MKLFGFSLHYLMVNCKEVCVCIFKPLKINMENTTSSDMEGEEPGGSNLNAI